MTIICVESAKAMEKTNAALELRDKYGAYVITDEHKKLSSGISSWQSECSRQMKRWKLAEEKEKIYPLVVLNGDLYQSFIQASENIQQAKEVRDMFLYALMNKKIGFPDRHFYLSIHHSTLLKREKNTVFYTKKQRFYTRLPSAVSIQTRNTRAAAQAIIKHLPSGPWNRYDQKHLDQLRQLSVQLAVEYK
ncbi:hypothetical protein SAMN05192534_11437 [Alteribacillus persepolensis]|uniref:Uncharacterized protein n=1 Tax=Alteribacillus persepolensis TaxID=568899 RepID=A0A1G8G4R3_9BACI|nr:hypothetical protein [Alteribacillus persepolensis]SDH89327.1 hypothetical protein SAMN05192534_11437 [Alteribacillus persepolensis]